MADQKIEVELVAKSNPAAAAQAGREDAAAYAKGAQSGLATAPPRIGRQSVSGALGYKTEIENDKIADAIATLRQRSAQKLKDTNLRYMRLTESMVKNYSMLTGAVLNPAGGLTMMFAARQVFSARRSQAERTRQAGGIGESITASALMTGGLVAGAASLGVALKGLQFVVSDTIDAFARSKKLWVAATMSGYGLQAQASISSTAKILGVDEREIYRFGKAYQYLNDQLKVSSKISADVAPALAETNIKWGILKENVKALGSVIAANFSDATGTAAEKIGQSIGDMAKVFNDSARTMAAAEQYVKAHPGLSVEKYWAQDEREQPVAKYKFMRGGAELTGKELENTSKDFLKFAENFKRSSMLGAPKPFMKQMGASTWEKMGLVVGGGGGVNYQAETFKQTKRMADILTSMYRGYKDMGAVSSLGGFPLPALP